MEYIEGGTFFDYLMGLENCRMSEANAKFFITQLIDIVAIMISRGVSHQDIKPQNLLLRRNFKIVIADLGFSTISFPHMGTIMGTHGYLAPERY